VYQPSTPSADGHLHDALMILQLSRHQMSGLAAKVSNHTPVAVVESQSTRVLLPPLPLDSPSTFLSLDHLLDIYRSNGIIRVPWHP
jgi:hypothetical protein